MGWKVALRRQLVMIMIRTRALMELYSSYIWPGVVRDKLLRLIRVCKKCVAYWYRFLGDM